MTITAYSTTARVNTVLPVNDPVTGTPLAPQNIWGAMFTSGGVRENGDRFGPKYLGGGTRAARRASTLTTTPMAMTTRSSSAVARRTARSSCSIRCSAPLATMDTAVRTAPATTGRPRQRLPGRPPPVAVTYRLYDMKGTPLDPTDDGAPLATLNYDPGTKTMGDFERQLRDAGKQWRRKPPGLLGQPGPQPMGHRSRAAWPQGMYRVNVNTTR